MPCLIAQSQLLALSKVIAEQRDAAEAANRSKSEFLANISHELRTPLHGILSYAQFGVEEAEAGDRGELREFFNNVGHSAETLLELVNDLLDLSKLEAGRMMFDLQPTCMDTPHRGRGRRVPLDDRPQGYSHPLIASRKSR